ncbi:hypothetical protein V2J09_007923 [Rumex salicifolius]
MATNAAVQEAKVQNPPPVGADGVGVVGVQQPPDDANSLLPKKLPQSDFVIVPSYSKWFDWNGIHDCEIRSMPEFFDGTSTFKNPSVYKYLRNSIVKKFRENPATKITFTEVRRTLVGDVVSIRRVFDFLDTWGLINFSPSTKQLQQTLVPRSDENKDISSSKSIDSAEPVSSERGKKVCSGCKSACTIACFVSDRYDLVLCARCYVRGNYRVGLNPNEFRRVEITENVRTDWTERETLLLMEAVMHYGDNWKRVAERVGGGRTDKECVARFIKLPFGEQYDPSKIEDEVNNIQLKGHKDTESMMESSAKKVRLTPLADASNPIMAQAAFLSALAGTEVAEAAAQAAVSALHDTDKGIGSGHKTGDALTLHAVDAEEAKAEILLNGEQDCVEDVLSSITQVQIEELQDKIDRFEMMELQLEEERQQLDQMRRQLFLDQVALLFHKDKGVTSGRSGEARMEETMRTL